MPKISHSRFKNRKIKYLLIAAVLLFLFAKPGFWSLVTNYFELRNLKKQIILLKKETAQFENELKQARKPQYIESAARKEFVMIKPGEKVYIFPPPDDK